MGEARDTPSQSGQLFRFCELDFPFPLGPADGRYLRRGPDGEDLAVVAVSALHAPRHSRLRGRRPTPTEAGGDAEAVPITRATVIGAKPFADPEEATKWLRQAVRGKGEQHDVHEAVTLLNSVLAAHRVAAQDPYVRDLVVSDALRVRLGYATGDGVLEGRWREAYVIPPDRARRSSQRRMLSPQEETAGILTGRRAPARPSEELLLRARLDLDHGRTVEAALVTRAATEALAAESAGAGDGDSAVRLAAAALAGGLSPQQVDELSELLLGLERAARRRRYADDA